MFYCAFSCSKTSLFLSGDLLACGLYLVRISSTCFVRMILQDGPEMSASEACYPCRKASVHFTSDINGFP